MPKLTVQFETAPILPGAKEQVSTLRWKGFIDAATYATLEKALDQLGRGEVRLAILDLSGVGYINSSGISAILRCHKVMRDRGGGLALASVPRAVAGSLHLLGVTSIVPILRTVEKARQFLGDLAVGKATVDGVLETLEADRSGTKTRYKVPVKPPPPEAATRGASVIVLVPVRNRFTDILRMRMQRYNGRFHLIHDPSEAKKRWGEIHPDLVVVDDRVDPRGGFVTRSKLERGRSLTSIIRIYGRGADVHKDLSFKVWENDYLVDPFEVMELFSLAEAEIRRVPRDRKELRQQVHFEFKTTGRNMERSSALARRLIEDSGLPEDGVTSLFTAYKEAVDNAAIHGNIWNAEKTIDVNYVVERRKITIIIEDQGGGFDFEFYLSRIRSREALDEARQRIMVEGRRGGLGILLMYRCTDRLEYRGKGNIVCLEKNT